MKAIETVGVVGAGSWGTALATLLAGRGLDTTIWAYEAEVAEAIDERHENTTYLPDIALDERLRASTDLAATVSGKDMVLSVSPSHVVRHVMAEAGPHIDRDAIVVSASKGIENESLKTMEQVLEEVLPEPVSGRLAFLSGPSFAREVAQRMPTAVAIASRDGRLARRTQEAFQTPYFRTYTNEDVVGVELGGALKNVVAIACGVSDGLGLGYNARAALITRGLAEITRLGIKLGADPLTFAGLAGMGDLVLTCTGDLSRNRTVGFRLGQGETLDDILASMKMVAEGVKTARSSHELALSKYVEMPITSEVYAILYKGRSARDALAALMGRDPKHELAGIA